MTENLVFFKGQFSRFAYTINRNISFDDATLHEYEQMFPMVSQSVCIFLKFEFHSFQSITAWDLIDSVLKLSFLHYFVI